MPYLSEATVGCGQDLYLNRTPTRLSRSSGEGQGRKKALNWCRTELPQCGASHPLNSKPMLTHAQELTRTMSSEPTRAAGVLFGRGHIDNEVLRRMGGVETQGFVDALIPTAPASVLLILPGQSWTIKGVAEGLSSVYGLCKFNTA